MHFKQVQTVEVLLNSLTCKFSGKQEKPHYALFKAITTHDVPKISENSATKLGLYNKAKNLTTFKWDYIDDFHESPNVYFDVSLECLKSSTLQICIFIDRYYINESRNLLYKRMNKTSMFANLGVKQVTDNDAEEISPQML